MHMDDVLFEMAPLADESLYKHILALVNNVPIDRYTVG